MAMDPQDVLLRRRMEDVANRPNVPDPTEEARKRDEDRWAQIRAREATPVPSQEVEASEAEGGDPASQEPEPQDAPEDRYYIEKSGTWYKLFDRTTGNQIGKSQRSEGDAWALLDKGE